MRLLFCADPLDNKVVDPVYEQEYRCAGKLGMETYLVSLESVLDGEAAKAVKRVPFFEAPESFIYRGWMLKPHDYEQLYRALEQKNVFLINTPSEYTHGHYFPYSYKAIQGATPQSIWLDRDELSSGFDDLSAKMHIFGNQPVMIKDYVKSRKHEWEEACYIPDASDQQKVQTVVRTFLDRQGAELNGGIVIRAFVQLEQLAKHPKSGMPLANEYRLFFLDHKLMVCTEYWDEAAYGQTLPPLEPFMELAKGITSRFFTMDIAKTANGQWTIIEIGDGQVSGLPGHADMERFYQAIVDFEGV